MLRVFWNLKSMVHSEFMSPGTTVKSEFCETLGKLQAWLPRVCPHIEQPLLQGDSAQLRTSVRITAKIHHLVFTVLHHPKYSPHLVPSDFHLLFEPIEHPRRHNFSSLMKSRWCSVVVTSRCTIVLWWKLLEHGQECVHHKSDYVEK
jgi:hypothetical protein